MSQQKEHNGNEQMNKSFRSDKINIFNQAKNKIKKKNIRKLSNLDASQFLVANKKSSNTLT